MGKRGRSRRLGVYLLPDFAEIKVPMLGAIMTSMLSRLRLKGVGVCRLNENYGTGSLEIYCYALKSGLSLMIYSARHNEIKLILL